MSSYEEKVKRNCITGSRNPPLPAYTQFSNELGANPHRFMCVVMLPWLDRSRGMIEWGRHCEGCREEFHFDGEIDGELDWRWLYTTSGYVEHFRQCVKSIEILRSIV